VSRLTAKPGSSAAFSLAEAVVAMAVAGIMLIALYTGMTSASYSIRLAREDLRATQVLMEKLEAIRLCNWEEVTDKKFMPTTFTVPIYPEQGAKSPVMNGTLDIDKSKLPTTYKNEVLLVTVTITWGQGKQLKRTRSISTYVAHYGITKYLLQKA